MPLAVDVILFDWGGTLAQVVSQEERLRAGAREAALRLVGREGAEVEDFVRRVLRAEAEAANHPELREADLAERISEWSACLDRPCEERAIRDAMACLCDAWIGSLETLPGAREALVELRRCGYQLGLVSNCMMPLATCRRKLERLGLAEHMNFAVFSSEVGYRKPSKTIYDQAVLRASDGRRLLEMSRILFVGDSPEFDVIAPAALGMKTALVSCRRGLWPAEAYARARPDLRIDAVSELPGLLA